MKFVDYKRLVASDLHRISGNSRAKTFIRHFILIPEFKYLFWMRTCKYLSSTPVLNKSLLFIAELILRHYGIKYGIGIPYQTEIGSGFYLAHYGCIVVSINAVIGKNCNLSNGVTLGKANRGKRQGFPVIGDNVYIGPGAKIIGAVQVGDNVAVGANCVVTEDVPANAVVVGIPGRVISYNGSEGYINRVDY